MQANKDKSFNAEDLDPMDETLPICIQGFKYDDGMYHRRGIITADGNTWDKNPADIDSE